MDWMVPRNRLDADQLAILNEIQYGEGNFFVRGCPGTGKSVLLAHAYKDFMATHPTARVCILTYTRALVACLAEGIRESGCEIYTFDYFCDWHQLFPFDLIFVDEVQDMRPAWSLEISRVAKRVVLFGDFGQSIYGGCLGESELMMKFNPKVLELNTIYRLTRSLKDLVQTVYPYRQINGEVGRLVTDTDIQLLVEPDENSELRIMADRIKKYASPNTPSAVLFSRKRRLIRFLHVVCPSLPGYIVLGKKLNEELKRVGVVFRCLGGGFSSFEESDTRPIVYLTTWHNSKGLDFESVGLPCPSKFDKGELKAFYVALTRARRNLFLSYNGIDVSGRMKLVESCSHVKKFVVKPEPQVQVGSDEEEIIF